MPSMYSPWLEMQSFSRCIHFLKASRYADLGTVIRYWWMADPSACRDCYFRPARNAFNFGNKKKSHGARSGEYVGWGKTPTFRVISRTVNLASPSMISFILETISYEMQILAYLISVHFWWTLHQTQISFSTAELCHKTHKKVQKQ